MALAFPLFGVCVWGGATSGVKPNVRKYILLQLINNGICLVVVVALLFYVHGKHLRSCRDGQLTYPHFSWAGLDLLSG